MNKKILIIVFAVIFIGVAITIYDLINNGYSYSGDFWQDTPEEALMKEADLSLDTMHTLTPKKILYTVRIEDRLKMALVSIDDTLVNVTFVTNEKGQYSVYGYSEEVLLDSPSMFLMNGDPEQLNFDSEKFVLFPYVSYNTTVYGWCYSGYSFTVNGKIPTKETYTFDCQGKTWSIDYWQVEGIGEDEDVTIEYVD